MATDTNKRITRELLFGAFLGPIRRNDDPLVFDRLISAVETETLRAGDVLFREGENAKYVHFMSEGRVRLTRPGQADWVYEGWWVLGTADVLVGRPRARTATVETETRFFRLPAALWFAANRDQPDALLAAITGFARGTAALRADLAPDGGFAPSLEAPDVDASTLVGRVRALAALPELRGMPVQVLVELAKVATIHELDAGEALFEPGAAPSRLHVVTRGLVELWREEPSVRGAFGPGALVGDLLFLGVGREAWGVRARSPSALLSFAADDLFDLLDERLDAMRALMTASAILREDVAEELGRRRGELFLR